MKITVNQDRCCSSGLCVLAAPKVFDQRDEDGVVVVLDPSPPPSEHRDVLEAATGCPTDAITVTDGQAPTGARQP
ncbi:ferredoxin [Streptomyces spiralis]|uniref:ferredoxin n=1 Tax=Streptomyces spiralis TaxID=66376 RepID=UPI0034100960